MPKAGELWLAEIPFTSGMASKLRPVLVLWEDMADGKNSSRAKLEDAIVNATVQRREQ
jgi:hypothetical protein